ncbi:MFS transporter [Clostridium hydrogenum]|uniref:MFS transporter n=1 Tax=Clostridium hydrogenum TaxID=2855764 RepID=UPI001F264C95|nr:MFS transporter [Clostridium hydrogenum]
MKSKLIRNKSFVLLLSSKFISILGTQIQDFALSLYVLKITGSAAKFASVLAVTILPQIILGPICGVFADWFDRKKMMIVLDIISGLIVISMGVMYKVNGILPMSYIYFAVIALAVVSLLYSSAASAVIPGIVAKEELLKANSINATTTTIPELGSALVSGIIFGFFGIYYVLIINAFSFFSSALIELFINIPKNTRKIEKFDFKQFTNDFKEGLAFIKNEKLILKIVISAFVINFALSPLFSTGLTYILKKLLFVSDAALGTLDSIVALGALAGSILAGAIGKKCKVEKIFGVTIISFGVIVMFLAFALLLFCNGVLSPIVTLASIIFISVLMTVQGMVINILISTLFQSNTPMEMMGRAGSVLSTVCTAAMPVGQIVIGGMFDYTKAYVPAILAGIIVLATGIVFTFMQNNSKNTEKITA